MTRQELFEYVAQEYGVKEDYPFDKDFETAILRHISNKKWFGIVMIVARSKVTGSGDDKTEVLNLKCDPIFRQPLLQNKGIYTAYHMNKQHWISVVLDEVTLDEIKPLVDMSFELTKMKIKNKR